jgi:hypothetical protein
MNKRKMYKIAKMLFDSSIATISFYSFITLIINLLEYKTIYINNYITCLIIILFYFIKVIYNSKRH